MKYLFFFIFTGLFNLFSDNIFAFDETIEFNTEHKFRITEIFKYDKCGDFYGENRPCFDIYNLNGKEVAGACIKNTKLKCKDFKAGETYKVTYNSIISKEDPDFDYDNIEILDIK